MEYFHLFTYVESKGPQWKQNSGTTTKDFLWSQGSVVPVSLPPQLFITHSTSHFFLLGWYMFDDNSLQVDS